MTEKTDRKPDCVLSDGTEVYFDKHNIKPREWKALFDPAQSDEDGERIMAKFAGIPFEKMHDVNIYDSQLLYAAAHRKIREPIDPNLDGESI